jgi:hypothetical protein
MVRGRSAKEKQKEMRQGCRALRSQGLRETGPGCRRGECAHTRQGRPGINAAGRVYREGQGAGGEQVCGVVEDRCLLRRPPRGHASSFLPDNEAQPTCDG